MFLLKPCEKNLTGLFLCLKINKNITEIGRNLVALPLWKRAVASSNLAFPTLLSLLGQVVSRTFWEGEILCSNHRGETSINTNKVYKINITEIGRNLVALPLWKRAVASSNLAFPTPELSSEAEHTVWGGEVEIS